MRGVPQDWRAEWAIAASRNQTLICKVRAIAPRISRVPSDPAHPLCGVGQDLLFAIRGLILMPANLMSADEFVSANNEGRREIIGALRSERKWDDAIRLLSEVISKEVRALEAHLMLADLYEEIGDGNAARCTLHAAQKIAPGNPWPAIKLAKLADKAGEDGARDDAGLSAQDILRSAALNTREGRHMAALFNEYCDLVARADIEAVRYSPSSLTWSARAPVPQAVLVGMVKDEDDIISSFLRYNYLIGFRKFALIDNASTDRTDSEVRKFQEAHSDAVVALVRDPIIGYYQDNKTTALVHFSRHYFPALTVTPEWIFPLDADEFMTFPGVGGVSGLKDLIDLADRNSFSLIQYYLINCASQKLLIKWGGSDPFSDFPVRESLKSRKSAKVAFRYNQDAVLHMGNHFVSGVIESLDDVLVASKYGVSLSHFSLRSAVHARSKYVNGGTAYAAAPDRAKHGRAWQLNFERYKTRGDMFFLDMVREYVEQVKVRSEH